LGESLRKALISDKPNPSREGCPDPKTLRDLAYHKRIGNPEIFERTTAHMAECSACVRDALGYAEEYKEQRRKRRTSRALFALVAGVVVSVGFWAVWSLQQKQRNPEIAEEVGPARLPGSPATISGDRKKEDRAPEIAQYETVTIELPLRRRGNGAAASPITLKRGRLLLEIRLSNGSPEGNYKLRIVDKSGKTQKMVEATARTEEQVTRLKVELDTSGLSPGDYLLTVLEPDLHEWIDHTLRIE
jgi:hypothetical protein